MSRVKENQGQPYPYEWEKRNKELDNPLVHLDFHILALLWFAVTVVNGNTCTSHQAPTPTKQQAYMPLYTHFTSQEKRAPLASLASHSN